jgi:restriction endonuclease
LPALAGVEGRMQAGIVEVVVGAKLYVKLPGWFLVPTPLGNYNPD